ncbi:MAG: thymidine phosphorylase [Candidatus Nanoarchaeia archaeon]
MFSIKRVDIQKADDMLAFCSEEVAQTIKVKSGDKVLIKSQEQNSEIICDLEVNCTYSNNDIGLNKFAIQKLPKSAMRKKVMILPAPKPQSLEHVRLKFENQIRFEYHHFQEILDDILTNRYGQIELTYFVLACSAHALNDKETIALTQAMVDCGMHLNFATPERKIIVDKHCIGGVPNNRSTMIAIPLIIAAGLTIPKTSSRSITSPAGTADTMEVLANVELGLEDMHHQVEELGGCIAWGGALDLSPADDLIIRVEHPLHIDSEGQMIASILSKKKSSGSTHVLIDIPYGNQTKVKTLEKAKRLKKRFITVGSAIGLEIQVEITNGSSPIGTGIGPYFEALDVLAVLSNSDEAPQDLKKKALYLTGEIFELAHICKKGLGEAYATELLESGKGFESFEQLRRMQGYKELPNFPRYGEEIVAQHDGVVQGIKNRDISKIAFILGAPTTPTAGLILKKKVGDSVKRGDVLFEMYSESEIKIQYGVEYLKEHFPYIY